MLSRILPAFLLLSLAASSQNNKPFFFLQMSDPQFGMQTSDRDFAQETAGFEFAIATANRLRPSFVVVCGDLINKPADPAQSAEYRRIAAKLNSGIRLFNVAGNHDVRNEPTPESLASYRKDFGPDYYSFRIGAMAGFVLNSSIIQHPDRVRDEYEKQERWLRGELEKAKRDGVRHRVVFQHIPWFLEDPAEPDQYFNIPRDRREHFLGLFRSYGVSQVFAGHYHRNALGRAGSLEMVTTGPVGKPLGPDQSGIRVVRMTPDGLNHRYYELGSLPNQVE